MALKHSYLLAGTIAIGVTAWMLSDNIFGSGPVPLVDAKMEEHSTLNFTVSAVLVKNEPVKQIIRANGVSEAEFVVTVSARASGDIVKVRAAEGGDIKRGDVLVRLDEGTLPEQIRAAQADLEVAKKRQEVTVRLAKENFSAPLEQAERAADYQNAFVQLTMLQKQLEDMVIKSPVSGHLEKLHVEVGERMRSEMSAATVLGLDKLLVVVAVPQNQVHQIIVGNQVELLVSGRTRQGRVTKIAAQSDVTTRTFAVNIEVLNNDRALRAGMTVEATIDTGVINGFGVSPAHLSVAENGQLMAKLSRDDVVHLVPVELVQAGAELVYISGVPDGAILLTVGQAFLSAGDLVTYRLASAS
jgi:multidrug efflux system membrane fusion protein